jgi:hypothetical protein
MFDQADAALHGLRHWFAKAAADQPSMLGSSGSRS